MAATTTVALGLVTDGNVLGVSLGIVGATAAVTDTSAAAETGYRKAKKSTTIRLVVLYLEESKERKEAIEIVINYDKESDSESCTFYSYELIVITLFTVLRHGRVHIVVGPTNISSLIQ